MGREVVDQVGKVGSKLQNAWLGPVDGPNAQWCIFLYTFTLIFSVVWGTVC
jgi:hypothetical protein